jgi:hypothetical protein
VIALGIGVPSAGQTLPEIPVKAAFVAKLPSFVTWPAAHVSGRADPATLCLSPAQPFRGLVAEFAGQTRVADQPLTVRHLRPGQRTEGCDALFVAPVDHGLLQDIRGRPVLTIGDEAGFCERGGIINLRVVDGRVRFEINLDGAREAALGIDSQLLALASRVHGGRR